MDNLNIGMKIPIIPCNGGLFISSGKGTHPTRVIDSYEIIYTVAGILKIFEEKQEFELHPGDALLLHPGKKHGGLADYPDDLSFYWLHFKLEDNSEERLCLNIPQISSLQNPGRMTELCRFFLSSQEQGRSKGMDGILLMSLILHEISIQNPLKVRSGIASSAIKIIELEFHSPSLSASSIAEKLGLNPDYLGRVFKSACGQTLTDFIHERRINEAKKLLTGSGLNIDETARRCGFSDTVYFRRIFRRFCGNSPLRYRKIYSQIHINTEK